MSDKFPWNDEHIEYLKKRAAESASYGVIAKELGTSRNSVIGKATRLGLPKRSASGPTGPRKVRATAENSFEHVNVVRKLAAVKRAQTPADCAPRRPPPLTTAEAKPEYVPPGARPCTLLELTEKSCRWPLGDPQHADFRFCGGEAVPGLPYCAHHARKAYGASAPSGRGFRLTWRIPPAAAPKLQAAE